VSRRWWLVALLIAAAVVVAAAVFASADPDGLERVAEDLGFAGAEQGAAFEIIPGYEIPGLSPGVGRILAGLAGIAIVLGVVLIGGRLLTRRRARGSGAGTPSVDRRPEDDNGGEG
jgi:hypothetical protein